MKRSELVEMLGRGSDDARWLMVERACLLAVERAGLVDEVINGALDVVRRRDVADPELRSRVDALTQALDEAAWDIQDRVEVGELPERAYVHAFSQARAAAAVGFALAGMPSGSVDSLYEAYHAIDDRDEFRRAVDTLSP